MYLHSFKGEFTMDNEKLFEFMTKMYTEMQEGFKGVNSRLGKVEEMAK